MPGLADTTIRLLGQEPLAGRLPTAEQLRIAEILDRAGYAYLEVSGGGCFESAVKRGIESPWERIRALRARVKTPLGLALRGRFLVGERPVDADFARRFVASAAENGIDVFRLHDPLNDVSNLREAAEAVVAARAADRGAGRAARRARSARGRPRLDPARAGFRRPARGGAGGDRPHPRRGRLAAARGTDRASARLAGDAERPFGEPLPDDRRRAASARRGPVRDASRADRPGGAACRGADRRPRVGGERGAAPQRGARAGRGDRRERGGAAAARPVRRRRRPPAAGH